MDPVNEYLRLEIYLKEFYLLDQKQIFDDFVNNLQILPKVDFSKEYDIKLPENNQEFLKCRIKLRKYNIFRKIHPLMESKLVKEISGVFIAKCTIKQGSVYKEGEKTYKFRSGLLMRLSE